MTVGSVAISMSETVADAFVDDTELGGAVVHDTFDDIVVEVGTAVDVVDDIVEDERTCWHM